MAYILGMDSRAAVSRSGPDVVQATASLAVNLRDPARTGVITSLSHPAARLSSGGSQ